MSASTEPTDFSIAEGPEPGARVWHFALRCGGDTRFATTVQGEGWSVTWPDLQRRIASCSDRSRLPHDLAGWMRALTQGAMPETVAEQAVSRIDAWLAAHRDRLGELGPPPSQRQS